jgi:hypothetical protein
LRSLFTVIKMPKAAFAICLVLFVFAPIVVQAQAGNAGAPVVLVLPDSITVKEGDVFNASVVIENLAIDHGMAGVGFFLTWNKTVLNSLGMTEVLYHTITPQGEWDNIWQLRCTVNNTGGYAEYACLWMDMRRAVTSGYCPVNGISGNHTLAIVTMKAVGAGSTTLNFSSVEVGDMHAASLLNIDDSTHYTPYYPGSDNAGSGNASYPMGTPIDNSSAITVVSPARPMIVPYSPETVPSLGNMTEAQKQDALTITEVPIGMLAVIGGMLITSPAHWRRRRKSH